MAVANILARTGAAEIQRARGLLHTPGEVSGMLAWYREMFDSDTKSWLDKSGNGKHLGPAVGTATQVQDGGRPAINFTGSVALKNIDLPVPQPATIYTVWRTTSVATTQVHYDGTDGVDRIFQYTEGGPSIRAGAPLELNGGAPAAGTVYASCFVANSNLSALYGRSNFVTPGVSGNAGTKGVTGLIVGARFSQDLRFTGRMWEMIIFAGAHSLAVRRLIGNYFNELYWRLGLSVVTS